MFRIINQSGHIAYGLKEYVCDYESDVNNLSLDDVPGSTAFIIENSKVYMMNNQHKWVDISGSNIAGGDIPSDSTELENLQKQIDNLVSKNEELTNTNNQLNQSVSALENEIEKLRIEIEELKNPVRNNTMAMDSVEGVIDESNNTFVLTDEDSEIINNTLVLN